MWLLKTKSLGDVSLFLIVVKMPLIWWFDLRRWTFNAFPLVFVASIILLTRSSELFAPVVISFAWADISDKLIPWSLNISLLLLIGCLVDCLSFLGLLIIILLLWPRPWSFFFCSFFVCACVNLNVVLFSVVVMYLEKNNGMILGSEKTYGFFNVLKYGAVTESPSYLQFNLYNIRVRPTL